MVSDKSLVPAERIERSILVIRGQKVIMDADLARLYGAAFIKLREILATHKELAQKLNELERRLDTHDDAIQKILAALRELMKPPAEKSKEIGFRVKSGSPARSGPKPESRGQR
ncbi:MAG: hypothetical protein HY801_09370 [Candidatus Lindowbacteria bacterium]|nr:hypothetical protein [Candidatus Lindowbacteria bacterium]